MRSPHKPHSTRPWSNAGPSRAGPDRRSPPKARALSASRRWLASKRSKTKLMAFCTLCVRIEADRSVSPIDQTDRRAHLELATPGLVELTTTHPRFEDVQLGLAHCAFEAEQEAIIEASRIVDAVFVKNERRRQRAQLDEAVPVGRVACQARDFQTHDNAGLAKGHLAHELLEAVAGRRARSG